jgi:hypothetical protein
MFVRDHSSQKSNYIEKLHEKVTKTSQKGVGDSQNQGTGGTKWLKP